VRKADAARLVEESRERGNVEASAKRLGIAVTLHEIAVMRADKALARLDAILVDAKRNGDLKAFNRAYKRHRQAAMTAGTAYMPYDGGEATKARVGRGHRRRDARSGVPVGAARRFQIAQRWPSCGRCPA
jgi:hypothetical protein